MQTSMAVCARLWTRLFRSAKQANSTLELAPMAGELLRVYGAVQYGGTFSLFVGTITLPNSDDADDWDGFGLVRLTL